MRWRITAAVCVALACALPAAAQQSVDYASVSGRVADPQGQSSRARTSWPVGPKPMRQPRRSRIPRDVFAFPISKPAHAIEGSLAGIC